MTSRGKVRWGGPTVVNLNFDVCEEIISNLFKILFRTTHLTQVKQAYLGNGGTSDMGR